MSFCFENTAHFDRANLSNTVRGSGHILQIVTNMHWTIMIIIFFFE